MMFDQSHTNFFIRVFVSQLSHNEHVEMSANMIKSAQYGGFLVRSISKSQKMTNSGFINEQRTPFIW